MSHCARNSLIAFSRPSISPSTKPRARHRLHREQSSAVSCGVFPNRRRGRALDGTNLYERTFLPRSHSSCAIPSGDETGGRRCEALPKQNNYREIRERQRNHETCQTEQGVEDDRPWSIPTHSGPYDRRPVSAYSDGLGHAVHRPDIGKVEKTCVPHSIPIAPLRRRRGSQLIVTPSSTTRSRPCAGGVACADMRHSPQRGEDLLPTRRLEA